MLDHSGTHCLYSSRSQLGAYLVLTRFALKVKLEHRECEGELSISIWWGKGQIYFRLLFLCYSFIHLYNLSLQVVLKHEPLAEIKAKGVMAGIYQEKEIWEMHIHNLESISLQLNSTEAREIVYHLDQAKSMYGNSISAVTNDVQKVRIK